MASVKNLKISLQGGTSNTYYANWDFDESIKISSGTNVKTGDYVTIKSGAKYYNGVHIPTWVMNESWKVTQIKGTRAVLGRSKNGKHNINSAIHTKYLSGGSGSSTTVSSSVDFYRAYWYYMVDGLWFSGGSQDTERFHTTYNAPDNAVRIKVSVKPFAKKHKVNGRDTEYFSGSYATAYHWVEYNPPEKPSVPTVKLDKFSLTASLENIPDARTDQIEFSVYNDTKLVNSGVTTVKLAKASFNCNVTAGGEYRVRCRAINLVGDGKVYGEWSNYSEKLTTIPVPPASITTCKATSKTSIYLEWEAVSTAKSYDIQYTTKKQYFEGSDGTSTVTGVEFNHYEKIGLETGSEYFFRIRAVNEQGSSSWSEIKSVVIGKDPAAPTTWSSATTVITGEPLNLYWVHNSEDGSSQTYAELEVYYNDKKETYTIQNTTNEDEKDKTSSYSIDTTSYNEGTKIKWRVRTAGITKAYGDWSIQRVVDIYAPPTLELSMTDKSGAGVNTLTSFPFYISGLTGPKTQAPTGYHLTINANQGYQTVDYIGNEIYVNAGETVYSKYFDTSEALLVELSANNLDLENGIEYTVNCIASMNSGLKAEAKLMFNVSWIETAYEPDVEISVDTDSLVAYVKPYVRDAEGAPIPDIMLSVYRRSFDGEFIELSRNIDNTSNTVITDPHPSLDYARYRIVATSKNTGAVSYYDPPGYPVNEKAIIIQWDEKWDNYDSIYDEANADVLETPSWTGSLLRLPYNIDVSDNDKTDVTLVNYVGRRYPVSYHGTHVTSSPTWNVSIPKDDKNTIYALRRLSKWTKDVYVREPSGTGYWAIIDISFNQKHCELTIPVTMNITRVVGGA